MAEGETVEPDSRFRAMVAIGSLVCFFAFHYFELQLRSMFKVLNSS